MTQSRTHNCGELRLADAGKTVTLAGWLENMREVGSNLAFVVLRDFYGTTQVVIESPVTLIRTFLMDLLNRIRKMFVLCGPPAQLAGSPFVVGRARHMEQRAG